jgi:hypothetical protein
MRIDAVNKTTNWKKSEKTELDQIDEYDTFENRGKAYMDYKGHATNAPKDYKKVRVHMIYDVKHDGRLKSRLVANGAMTEIPVESVYSGVVSLRSLRIVVFLAELNTLELWGADVGNAYLESYTKEKVYIIAGPEFGDREGQLLIVRKALYGLRGSGQAFHEKFADTLLEMGFTPSKADADVWMRENNGLYEYIAVYVDDLCIAMKDPGKLIDELRDTHNYKLKGVGPIKYHLGCNFERDKDGTLRTGPKKDIDETMIPWYENTYGTKPTNCVSPLEKGDHPELDTSDLTDEVGIKQYQSMIGQLQWLVALGRMDVFISTMTMSRWRTMPRKGHLERLKRIFGYVQNKNDGYIRIRTGIPDYSNIPERVYDWARSVYGNVKEELPKDAPKPLGKEVVITTYVDANLMHDLITGRSITAILHFLNQTPVEWYTKRQATVENATFGSEFVAARTGVDQLIDLRYSLRYFGVPIKQKSYMFGDNESVVKNSTVPHSQLKKRHIALSYHRVREAIASGIVVFHHIRGVLNPADILSKHWGWAQVCKVLTPLLFWHGETNIISDTIATKPNQAKGELQVSHHEVMNLSVGSDESDKTHELERYFV